MAGIVWSRSSWGREMSGLARGRSRAKEAALFFIISLLFFVSLTTFDPFVASYAASLGIPAAMIGTVVGITGLASAFARLPLGIASGFVTRRKPFIQAGFALTIICWTAAWLAPGPATLLIGKLSNGFAGAVWVIYTVMFASLFAARDGAKAMALISTATPLGSLAGSTIGGLVIHAGGYSAGFAVAVFAALLALALTFFLREEETPASGPVFDRQTLRRQCTDRRLWAISLLGIVAQMTMYGTRDTFTPLMAERLGAGPIAVSWLANTHLALFALSTALCPWLFRRLGLVRTGVVGFAAQGAAIVLMPAANALPALFALQAAAGVAYGMAFTYLMSIVLDCARPQEKTTRMGFFQSMYSLGVFAGPILLGLLVQGATEAAGFIAWGLLSAAGAVLVRYSLPAPAQQGGAEMSAAASSVRLSSEYTDRRGRKGEGFRAMEHH